MALRGENIGTAYVRILADGTGLDKSVRDEFRKAEPEMRQSGERASEKYNEGFESGMVRATKKNRKAMLDSLSLGRGEMDARAEVISSNFAKELRNNLRKAVKGTDAGGKGDTTLADTIWNNLMGDFRRTGNKDIFGKALENLVPQVERATRQIVAAEKAQLAEVEAAEKKFRQDQDREWELHIANLAQLDRERLEVLTQNHAEALRENKEFDLRAFKQRLDLDKQWELHIEELASKEIQEHERSIKERLDLDKQWEIHIADLARAERQAAEDRAKAIKGLGQDISFLNREVAQLLSGDKNATSKPVLADRLKDVRHEMGRLNVENSVWTETLRDHERTLMRLNPAWNRYNRGVSKFSKMLGPLTGKGSRNDFVNIIGSLATGLITGPLRLIGTLGDGLTTLGRNLSAVRSGTMSLGEAFGGIGGLAKGGVAGIAGLAAVAGGLLLIIGPLVASLSMLLAAITALASSVAFAAVGALGALAGAALPAAAMIGGLAFAIANLNDTGKSQLKEVGGAFKDLGKTLASGFQMDRTGPMGDQIRTFGESMKGFERMVRKMQPLTRSIGRSLGYVLDTFIDKVGEAGGPWDKFMDSMRKGDRPLGFLASGVRRLGRSFSDVFGGLLGLLRGLKPIANDFIDWVSDGAKRFNDWANSARGQNSIKQFFEDAKESIKSVGGFLKEVGGFLGEILSKGRESGNNIFDNMARGVAGWTEALRKDPEILNRWFDSAVEFASALGRAARGFTRVVDALDTATTRAVGVAYFESLGIAMSGIGEGISLLVNPIGTVARWFARSGDAAAEAKGPVDALAGSFDKVTGAVTRQTRALVLDKLNKSEVIAQTRQYGIATQDLIGAVMGLPGPTKRVNDALNKNKDLLNGLNAANVKDDLAKLGVQFDLAALKAKRNADQITTWKEKFDGLARSIRGNKQLKTQIKLIGSDASFDDLQRLQKQFKLTPKEVKTTAKVLGFDITMKNAKDMIAQWKKLDGQKANPTVGTDRKPFDKDMNSVDAVLNRFDAKVVYPTIRVESAAALTSIRNIAASIDNLHDRTIYLRTVHTTSRLGGETRVAAGRIFSGATRAIIGEAGPEAVVPLNRPLNLVDPSVRWLSAIAQGKQGLPRLAGGGVAGGRTIDASGWQIITPTKDPVAVATEVLNKMTASLH